MSAPGHLLLRASAGTGKTQALSDRYLALLLGGVDPDRVLATTFTRRAAHEILDRILARLADAAAETEAGRAKRELLARSLGRPVSAEECLATLERLLRGMDRIRIGTIDSFFAQLARLFALDLGLPAGWRIADEAESELLRSEAVADAVAGTERAELLDLLRDFQRQAVGQSAHDVLLRFAQEGREKLLESEPEAWTRIVELPDVEPASLAAAVAALPRFRIPTTKAGKPFVRWTQRHEELSQLVGLGDWHGVLESTLAKRSCAATPDYDKAPIEADQLEILRPLVAHALHLRTAQLVLENRAARALLERYERSYQALARARGLLRFEDVPAALASLSGEDRLASRGVELAHRIDGSIDHLLLDEFQDTAPVQWRVLRPIATGILADGSGERSFFCVGDEKQSIYGWRAAEPRLLRFLDRGRPTLRADALVASYRSSRAVLGAVNEVFGSIARNPAFESADAEVLAAAEEVQASFLEHVPARERPGAVHVVRTRLAEEGEDESVPGLEAAVERVRDVLADAPRASVGVLMRVRKRIPELIRRLREKGILASDEGGNPLTDSAAVLHALSLLRLADHPSDTMAAFHVATSPLGPIVGLEPLAPGESVARGVRAKLADLGFGGYLASIRPSGRAPNGQRAALEGYGEWDLDRYDQLVDLALAWEDRAGSRPSAFVEHVHRTKVEDRGAAQVRVMTVHGAKGLEFDAVVLPDLDPRTRHGGGLLSRRPDPEGPIDVVTRPIPKEVSIAHAELELVRADVARREAVEGLCVLYVAMTRAIHRLDLIVRGREKEGGSTHGAIVRGAFGVPAVGPAGVAWSHPENSTRWFPDEIGPTAGPEGPEGRIVVAPLHLAAPMRSRSIPARSPSKAKDQDRVVVSRLLMHRDAATARGRIVHRLLEEVEWIETFDRSDEDLLAIARKVEADPALAASALAEFRASLARPETRRLLTRPGEDAVAWRERPFSILLPDHEASETLWTGAFDRVVLRREGASYVSAEIVDFKTDRVAGEAIVARAETYRPQMEAYRRVLARMTGLDGSRIRARLLFLSADAVVDV